MNITYGFPPSTWDPNTLPDGNTEFVDSKDIEAFAKALSAPEANQVVALNDWRPVNQRVKRKGTKQRRRRPGPRSKDETREGFVYVLLKWPLLLVVVGWIVALGLGYLVTRLYIWTYERMVTWRGQRQKLRKALRSKTNYEEWKEAAQDLDKHLGNDVWKEDDDYAYYDSSTARKVTAQLRAGRARAEDQRNAETNEAVHALRSLVEACGTSLLDYSLHWDRIRRTADAIHICSAILSETDFCRFASQKQFCGRRKSETVQRDILWHEAPRAGLYRRIGKIASLYSTLLSAYSVGEVRLRTASEYQPGTHCLMFERRRELRLVSLRCS